MGLTFWVTGNSLWEEVGHLHHVWHFSFRALTAFCHSALVLLSHTDPPTSTSHTSLSLQAPNSTRCLNFGDFNDENIRPTYLQIWTPPKNVTTTIISDKNTFWSQAHKYPRHCTVLPPGVSQYSRKQEQKSVAHKSWYATVWFRILSGTENITQPSLQVSKQQR